MGSETMTVQLLDSPIRRKHRKVPTGSFLSSKLSPGTPGSTNCTEGHTATKLQVLPKQHRTEAGVIRKGTTYHRTTYINVDFQNIKIDPVGDFVDYSQSEFLKA